MAFSIGLLGKNHVGRHGNGPVELPRDLVPQRFLCTALAAFDYGDKK